MLVISIVSVVVAVITIFVLNYIFSNFKKYYNNKCHYNCVNNGAEFYMQCDKCGHIVRPVYLNECCAYCRKILNNHNKEGWYEGR